MDRLAEPPAIAREARVAAMLRGVRFGRFWTAVVSLLARAASAVCFRRVRVIGGPLPAGRPLLVIANHPAAWTDVTVLTFGLRRRLHFLAQRQLFEPASRAWFLRLFGSLPVMVREQAHDAPEWNAAIFRACHALLDRGEPVAMFPEGASVSDRGILPLKPGFARFALDHARRGGGAGALAVVPVGIHYEDRAAFRSDVEVLIGPELTFPWPAPAAGADHDAVDALVRQGHVALARLVVDLPDAEQQALQRELEPVVIPQWRDGCATPQVVLARELAASIAAAEAHDPAALDTLWRHAKTYRRAREALGLGDDVWRMPRAQQQGPGAIATALAALLGVLPALVVTLVNLPPHMATVAFARRYAPQSNRVMFARLGFGAIAFPVYYLWLALALWRFTGWPVAGVAGAGAILVAGGLATLACGPWLLRRWALVRLAWFERARPADVRAARTARAALLAALDAARALARAPGSPPAGTPLAGHGARP